MRKAGSLRTIGLIAGVSASALIAGCTVRPMYSDSPIGSSGQDYGMATELASIAIKPVNNRPAQVVRNKLIFALSGGKGEPADPKYTLNLTVLSRRDATTLRQVSRDYNEPSSATITLAAIYELSTNDGTRIATGKRQITSSFDVPLQAFAEMRAERDAQDRAALELAQQLRLALAQDLSRKQ